MYLFALSMAAKDLTNGIKLFVPFVPVVGRAKLSLSLPLSEAFLPREIFFCKQPVSVPGKFRDARPTRFTNFTELLGKLTAVDNLRFCCCIVK